MIAIIITINGEDDEIIIVVIITYSQGGRTIVFTRT
jgi:hypothetical protein